MSGMMYLTNFTKFLIKKMYIPAGLAIIFLGVGFAVAVQRPVGEVYEVAYKFTNNTDKSISASYVEIADSQEVYDAIAGEYQGRYSVNELKSKIQFAWPLNTRVIAIIAKDTDRDSATRLSKVAAKHTVPRLRAAFSLPEDSIKPIAEPSAKVVVEGMSKRNILFFGAAGLAIGIVAVWFVYDLRVNGNNKKGKQ